MPRSRDLPRRRVRCPPRPSFSRLTGCVEFSRRAVRSRRPPEATWTAPGPTPACRCRPDLPPGSTDYDITVDLANFSAEKMVFGQKAEAQALHVTANN